MYKKSRYYTILFSCYKVIKGKGTRAYFTLYTYGCSDNVKKARGQTEPSETLLVKSIKMCVLGT